MEGQTELTDTIDLDTGAWNAVLWDVAGHKSSSAISAGTMQNNEDTAIVQGGSFRIDLFSNKCESIGSFYRGVKVARANEQLGLATKAQNHHIKRIATLDKTHSTSGLLKGFGVISNKESQSAEVGSFELPPAKKAKTRASQGKKRAKGKALAPTRFNDTPPTTLSISADLQTSENSIHLPQLNEDIDIPTFADMPSGHSHPERASLRPPLTDTYPADMDSNELAPQEAPSSSPNMNTLSPRPGLAYTTYKNRNARSLTPRVDQIMRAGRDQLGVAQLDPQHGAWMSASPLSYSHAQSNEGSLDYDMAGFIAGDGIDSQAGFAPQLSQLVDYYHNIDPQLFQAAGNANSNVVVPPPGQNDPNIDPQLFLPVGNSNPDVPGPLIGQTNGNYNSNDVSPQLGQGELGDYNFPNPQQEFDFPGHQKVDETSMREYIHDFVPPPHTQYFVATDNGGFEREGSGDGFAYQQDHAMTEPKPQPAYPPVAPILDGNTHLSFLPPLTGDPAVAYQKSRPPPRVREPVSYGPGSLNRYIPPPPQNNQPKPSRGEYGFTPQQGLRPYGEFPQAQSTQGRPRDFANPPAHDHHPHPRFQGQACPQTLNRPTNDIGPRRLPSNFAEFGLPIKTMSSSVPPPQSRPDGPVADNTPLSNAMLNPNPTPDEEELLAAALVDGHNVFGAPGGQRFESLADMFESEFAAEGFTVGGDDDLHFDLDTLEVLPAKVSGNKNNKNKNKNRNKNRKLQKAAKVLESEPKGYDSTSFLGAQFPDKQRETLKELDELESGPQILSFDAAKKRIQTNDSTSSSYATRLGDVVPAGAFVKQSPNLADQDGEEEGFKVCGDETSEEIIKETKKKLVEGRKKYDQAYEKNLESMKPTRR